ncbi:MAG: hypothetical protein QXW58_07185 [Thermosphaera sp.]
MGSTTSFSIGGGTAGPGIPISLPIHKPVTFSFSRYDVDCKFCGRRYYYYDIKFPSITNIVKVDKSVVKWLKRENINVADLPNIVVGVVEPKGSIFKEYSRRLKRKFGRPVSDRFLEVIFEVKVDNIKSRKGVLHGRIYEKETGVISYIVFEYATWL